MTKTVANTINEDEDDDEQSKKVVVLGHVLDCRKRSQQGTVSDAWREGKSCSMVGEEQERQPLKVKFINTSTTQELIRRTYVGDAFGLFLPSISKDASSSTTAVVSETTQLLPSAKNEMSIDHDNNNDEQSFQIVAAYRPMTCRLPPNDMLETDHFEPERCRVRHCVTVSPLSSSSSEGDDGGGPNKNTYLKGSTSNIISRYLYCCVGNNNRRIRRRGCSCGCCIDNNKVIADDDEEECSTVTSINTSVNDWIVDVDYEIIRPTTPYDTTTKEYLVETCGPWTLRCEPGCWESENDTEDSSNKSIKQIFYQDLQEATRRLPSHIRIKLPQWTTLWCNKSQRYGPCQEDFIVGKGVCFHPHADWLKKNGERVEKQGSVEFYSMNDYIKDRTLWGPGGLILHELCHAYHFKFVKDGYDNTSIQQCYKNAIILKLYDNAPVRGPQGPKAKAYACTDAQEFFAELSVAFLSDGYFSCRDDDNDENDDDVLDRDHDSKEKKEYNKWYPSHRTQLQTHDPNAYQLLHQLWSSSSTS